MGVSSTARLPSLGAQSIPPLFSHLQRTSNAKVVSRWSITIRSFRAVPVPTNAWPSSDQYDSSFHRLTDEAESSSQANASSNSLAGQPSTASVGGSGSSASGAPPLTKPRTIWQVMLSDYPGVVFVIVEDTGRPSRAKAWRDWEISMKKWKKAKRKEIEARRRQQEKAQAKAAQEAERAERTKEQSADAVLAQSEEAKAAPEGEVAAPTESSAVSGDKEEPMDVDAATSATAPDAKDTAQTDATIPSDSTGAQQQSGADALPTTEQSADNPKPEEAEEEEPIELAGPKPKLRLPSHTRYTISALTSSMSAMLTGLNLPPPHGAPVGTAGPGAWVPRGAAVSIEGLVLEINSQSLNALPGISPALASVSSTDDVATLPRSSSAGATGPSAGAGGPGGVDWRVRVGSVMGGGGRSAGAIVEAEFLPVSTLLPTSKFMHDFLHSLFPPGLVPMPPAPAPGMPNQNLARGQSRGLQNGSAVASTTGIPRSVHTTLGQANGMNGATATAGGLNSFSYTIGGGGAGAIPPNRSFNIPVLSDQLWEEVVPRSGEGWRRRIAKRSHHMKVAARVQRRQRKNAAEKNAQNKTSTNGANGTADAFGWHTFGSDDEEEVQVSTHANGDWQGENEDEFSSSDSEAEQTLLAGSTTAAGGLSGTAVTMQLVDEDDDDDDDDRPLGAPIWTNSNRASSTAPASTAQSATADAAAAKKEDAVQLIFQGLRPDERESADGAEEDGWTGIERGRRVAFQYVQMLRAEGII